MSHPIDVKQNPDGSWTAKGGSSFTVVSVTCLTEHKAVAGHAAAMSCAAVVSVLMLGAAWAPLLLLIPAVGWSRVVLRAHSLAQVVAGSLFGGVVMAGIWWLLRGWLLG